MVNPNKFSMKFFRRISVLLIATASPIMALSQWHVDQLSQSFTINFDTSIAGVNHGVFTATGYSPSFFSGGLDSDAWSVFGLSSGDLRFGDSAVGGDFGRSASSGGVSTGGIYAFDVDATTGINRALGVQPGGSDFTPGYHLLKVINASGDTAGGFTISYNIYEYNDQNRASLLEFHWAKDSVSYTYESALDFVSGEAADANPAWKQSLRSLQINTTLLPGDSLLFKWYSDDYSGSGSRDELALDSISIVLNPLIDQPPQIGIVYVLPQKPSSGQGIDISAFITDDNGIDTAYLLWGLDSGALNGVISMIAIAPDTFMTSQPLPGQADSSSIYFKIVAGDSGTPPQHDTSEIQRIDILDPLPVALPGDIIITELMINPALVSDSRGEYIELYNASSNTFDLEGYLLQDAGNDSLIIDRKLIIRPREFLVLARDTMAATNGGFQPDYEYGSFTLSNLNDEVYLISPHLDTVDKVEYNGGLVWLGSGAAIVYQGAVHQDNNDPSLWSAATSRQPGYIGAVGDFGSPGTDGLDQVVDHLVYAEGAWSKVPDSASGNRKALVRREEMVLFSADASVQRLVVEPLAGVDLGGFLLEVRDSLVLEADSNGYSQLIGEVDGRVVWQSFLRSSPGARWFNLAIPLITNLDSVELNKGGMIRTLAETGGDTGLVNIWKYDAGVINPITGEGTWHPVSDKQETTLAKGFSLYSGSPHFGSLPQTLTAIGKIEHQDVQVSLHNLSGAAQYNFVGNPFTSAIDWDEIARDNPGINKTYFIYDDGPDSSWVAYSSVAGTVSGSAGPLIAPGQAFFLNATNTALLDIEKDARSIQSSPSLFRKVKPPAINVLVKTDKGRQDFTYLGFLPNASDTVDISLDALKRTNGAKFSPSLYSSIMGENYVFNFLNDHFNKLLIPLTLELDSDADVQIDFEMINIDPSWSLTVEDLKEGISFDPGHGTYNFRHIGSEVNRIFMLHIDKSPLRYSNQGEEGLSIHIGEKKFVSRLSQGEIARIEIYSISGKYLSGISVDHGQKEYRFDKPDYSGLVVLVLIDHFGRPVLAEKIQLD
jgi:hypothetical protein